MKTNILILFLLFSSGLRGQGLEHPVAPMSYTAYMEKVFKQHIGYAAERLNIDISEAEITAARLFNDPRLSFEYSNNDDHNLHMGQGFSAGLSKTFSPGKRGARIDLAASEKELNQYLLDDYLHTLRAEATLAYLEALKQSEFFRVKQDAYENVFRLAQSDSIKNAQGSISKIEVIQSTLEAGRALNDLTQARTELQNAHAALRLWTGEFDPHEFYLPQGSLRLDERTFDALTLVESAVVNRADLAAALKNVDVAKNALKLTRRERGMDFDLGVGYYHNTKVRNEIAPAPRFNGVSVGMSVPLKFSNLNRGAVHSAQYRMQQAEYNYRQAELEIKTAVMENLRRYLSLLEQIRQFESGLLAEAKAVVNGIIESHDRGEVSLHEVLNARQTYDNLRIAYTETLYNCAASLVTLERSVGIWNISIP